MSDTAHFLAFVAASLVLILIPGPSVMFTISRALIYGRRQAVLTAWGNAAGTFCASALAAVGLGALISESALAFAIVKYAGAAYLVYLGVKALRDRKGLMGPADDEPAAPKRTLATVAEGFLVGLLNPKSILFFLAILPQFVDPASGSATVQMLVLGGTFAVLAAACDSVWGLVASAARDVFRRPRPKRILANTGGTALIGLGIAAAAGERA
ncbi:Threonine/homoserine/homoserine lactone efflux protein [Glycomyces sambucus]|uniref:Threonine/homoserine/homoserine lactone efflux protein n=1 Tax=Glycomyces sambucus TaxID=380244 RepID=A0A1G9MGD4_9ACTN|nr:LysE family translocator [Glycomyces sambucus]SDL73279.1 Threonine/homoserine/homoserine lactone efflux protein [Glycomyces sambucus]